MDEQQLSMGAPEHSGTTLQILEEIIDDPKARARTRLDALQKLKKHLLWLMELIEAPQTAPKLRKELIETLRSFRRL